MEYLIRHLIESLLEGANQLFLIVWTFSVAQKSTGTITEISADPEILTVL